MRFSRVLCAAIALCVVLGGVAAAVVLLQPGSAPARRGNPLAMLEADAPLNARPARTLRILRSMGVDVVRMQVGWSAISPDPSSPNPPPWLNVLDPGAYPAAGWAPYDKVVRTAHAAGLQLDFVLAGDAPRWALGPNPPPAERASGVWKPSAMVYGQFVEAVARRYSGDYVPPGASSPLPRVNFWEIWNEPNWGPALQPQMAIHPLRIVSATEYRQLADAAWSAFLDTGHGHDTIVIGNLSPRGVTAPPDTALQAAVDVSGPLAFTRTLYCVDSGDRPLRGDAALRADCPTTAAGSKRFALAHPVLFQATGFGVHPYPIGLPPTEADESSGGDTVQFSQIPQFARVLDRDYGVYGSQRRMPIYNTEFGYITHPPNPGTEYVSPSTAARYLNWAEYLTWRNPRIATTMQFQLYDSPGPSAFGAGGFASALIFSDGKPKRTFYAYRMPIFLPVTRAARGHALEVWGCARPARYAYLDTHRPQYVRIQFRPGSSGPFHTIRTVRLDAARSCYFDVDVRFQASGTVHLAWSDPSGDPQLRDPVTPGRRTIHSRPVEITIH